MNTAHPSDTAESLRLKVDGHEVHYLRAGEGPPVVLLHGGASDCRDWQETITALSPFYSVYAPDMIGFGQSDRRGNGYYLSDFVDSTIMFMKEIGLSRQAMVGHSLGGRVCLEIAYRHPDTVNSLVLVDTVGFKKLSLLGTVLGTMAWGVRQITGRKQPYPRLLTREGEGQHWLCVEKLPAIDTPTLIIWSEHDPYCPIAGAKKAAELMPRAELQVFPGFGHAPHIRWQEGFNSLLLGFLHNGH